MGNLWHCWSNCLTPTTKIDGIRLNANDLMWDLLVSCILVRRSSSRRQRQRWRQIVVSTYYEQSIASAMPCFVFLCGTLGRAATRFFCSLTNAAHAEDRPRLKDLTWVNWLDLIRASAAEVAQWSQTDTHTILYTVQYQRRSRPAPSDIQHIDSHDGQRSLHHRWCRNDQELLIKRRI